MATTTEVPKMVAARLDLITGASKQIADAIVVTRAAMLVVAAAIVIVLAVAPLRDALDFSFNLDEAV